MLAVHAAWPRLGYPEDLYSARERAHGIHGGDIETSLMLAFRPETVRMGEARDFSSAAIAMEREFKQLRATQPIGFGWMTSDLNQSGAVGDAANATAAKGEACAEHGADAFVGSAAGRRGVRPRAPRRRPDRLTMGAPDFAFERELIARGCSLSRASTRSAAGRSPGRSAWLR